MQLAPEPDLATYAGALCEEGRGRAVVRDFSLSLFQTRESYERAVHRAGEIMAHLRETRPAERVLYRMFWLDDRGVHSTPPTTFFSSSAFAFAVTTHEGLSMNYGPQDQREHRARLWKVRIVSVARGARKIR
jgi:hypothetical protein